MSNYTPTTDFSAKDSMQINNPLKVAKGADITVELLSIASAISSKVNNVAPVDIASTSGFIGIVGRGSVNHPAIFARGDDTTGGSMGLGIQAGSNTSDYALNITNAANTATFMTIDGAGNLSGTIFTSGTFTVGTTGFSGSAPSGTASYFILANALVVLTLPPLLGTSNSSTFTLTGIPAAIRPNGFASPTPCVIVANDNGQDVLAVVQAGNNSTWTMSVRTPGATAGGETWTTSNSKGIPAITTIVYRIIA